MASFIKILVNKQPNHKLKFNIKIKNVKMIKLDFLQHKIETKLFSVFQHEHQFLIYVRPRNSFRTNLDFLS